MVRPLAALLVGTALACAAVGAATEPACRSFLFEPSYCIDSAPGGPARPYLPQAGDIYLATDKSFFIRAGHRLAGSGAPHHSGIIFTQANGRPAILEAGPFNSLRVAITDVQANFAKHEERGELVWVRQRRVPLTPEQAAALTAFAERQDGKRFAAGRMLLQLTPIRSRGPLRTYIVGKPRGEINSYFCSELVLEACVYAGLVSPCTTRPTATFPRDIFFDESPNPYLNTHFSLAPDWCPPARWSDCAACVSR